MLDAYIIDKLKRDRQREQDRRSWDRTIHAPQPEPPQPRDREDEQKRGSTTVNFEL